MIAAQLTELLESVFAKQKTEALEQGSLSTQDSWASLRWRLDRQWDYLYRDGKLELCSMSQEGGLFAEASYEGAFAYGALSGGNSLKDAKLVLEQALKNAKLSSRNRLYNFSPAVRPVIRGHFSSPLKVAPTQVPPELLLKLLARAEKAMKAVDKRIVSAKAYLHMSECSVCYVCRAGSELEQNTILCSLSLSATAAQKDEFQTRSDGGFEFFQSGLEQLDDDAIIARAVKIAQEAVELLDAEPCPTGVMDVVLAPDQMVLQLHESVGHPLELDRILGDERNYAGSSFVKLEDFGKLQYGSALMNVVFDPTVAGECASIYADDGGEKATREYLIKEGQLVRALGGLESRERSGVAGVACFRSSAWNRPACDRMGNLNLEYGKESFEDLIKGVEKGIYMQTNRSWSIDDIRLNFQFGCQYARLIEHGKLSRVVKNPNYRGMSNSFWKSLDGVGNKESLKVMGVANCGKAEPNQVIFVGHACPPCRFRQVQVFGAGEK